MDDISQQDEGQLTLLNFSFENCGFEYTLSNGLEFDQEFNQRDAGQLQNEPTLFDEADLLSRLRDVDKRDSIMIPPTLYEFYDKCRKHFCKEFVELLAGYIVNIEKAKRLKNVNIDGHLLNFFEVKLVGPLNFGIKHQLFIDCAAECDDEIKSALNTCGKELQKIAQAGREHTFTAARNKLQACSTEFETFGRNLWIQQCSRTSLHNILDQHFAVRTAKNAEQEDEADTDEFRNAQSASDSTRFEIWPMSTWLYNAAIHDSKKDVDVEIRKRRAQIIKAAADEATKRARQATVNLRADAARPEDAAKILGQRFKDTDQKIIALDQGLASIAVAENANATESAPAATRTRRTDLGLRTSAQDSYPPDA